METPVEATIEAMKTFNGISILNAAPSMSSLPAIAFKLPDIFCVNELEAEDFTNLKFTKVDDAKKIIQTLINERGCKLVILTLGKNGAAFNDNDQIYHVPIQEELSSVVDSTG